MIEEAYDAGSRFGHQRIPSSTFGFPTKERRISRKCSSNGARHTSTLTLGWKLLVLRWYIPWTKYSGAECSAKNLRLGWLDFIRKLFRVLGRRVPDFQLWRFSWVERDGRVPASVHPPTSLAAHPHHILRLRSMSGRVQSAAVKFRRKSAPVAGAGGRLRKSPSRIAECRTRFPGPGRCRIW